MIELIAVPMFKPLIPYFEKLFNEREIRLAGLNYTVEEWTGIFLFVSVLTLIFSFLVGFVPTFLLYGNLGISLVAGFMISFFSSSIVIFYFKIYLKLIANSRAKRIDNVLHFASLYMATIAGSGAPPVEIFKVMSKLEGVGEVRKIAANIVRDIDVFGLSLTEALEKEAKNTPSQKFRELLWGIKKIITSGGDLQSYLVEKGNRFLEDYKRRLEEFSRNMSMLIEVYTTIVIVGSIFAIVLSALMGAISGFTPMMKMLQYGILLFGLPVATLFFIVLIKSLSPSEV